MSMAVDMEKKSTSELFRGESKVFVGGFDLCGEENNRVQTKNLAAHTLYCYSQLWGQRARAVLEEKDP